MPRSKASMNKWLSIGMQLATDIMLIPRFFKTNRWPPKSNNLKHRRDHWSSPSSSKSYMAQTNTSRTISTKESRISLRTTNNWNAISHNFRRKANKYNWRTLWIITKETPNRAAKSLLQPRKTKLKSPNKAVRRARTWNWTEKFFLLCRLWTLY